MVMKVSMCDAKRDLEEKRKGGFKLNRANQAKCMDEERSQQSSAFNSTHTKRRTIGSGRYNIMIKAIDL